MLIESFQLFANLYRNVTVMPLVQFMPTPNLPVPSLRLR